MITNTQRILYEDGYYPAHIRKVDSKINYQGYNYNIVNFKERTTNKVWKVELANGIVSYFSECMVYTDLHWLKPIDEVKVGDLFLTYSPGFSFESSQPLAKIMGKAFVLNDEKSKSFLKHKLKLRSLKNFKLLALNKNIIADFLCEIVKYKIHDFSREYIIIKKMFNYELLQEILLACSLFGITAMLKKEEGEWNLYINNISFMKFITNSGHNMLKTQAVTKITEIKQETQSFKIEVQTINNLVVNSVMIKGDA